jgi:hypothetical protein
MHRIVGELLAVMPREGDAWQRRAREKWLAALAAVLDVLYDEEEDPSVPRARVGRQDTPRTERAGSPFVDGPRPGTPPSDEAEVRLLDLRAEPIPMSAGHGRHARRPPE